jgi:hypothetical protein
MYTRGTQENKYLFLKETDLAEVRQEYYFIPYYLNNRKIIDCITRLQPTSTIPRQIQLQAQVLAG